MSLVTKNIGAGRENDWGDAVGASRYPRVRNFGINFNMGTKVVDDTPNTSKGFSNLDDLRVWLSMVLGIPSVGSPEANVYTHLFEQGNTIPFYTFLADKGVLVDRIVGAMGASLKLNAANDITEGVLSVIGKDKETGRAYTPSVTEIDPFTFDQVNLGVGDDIAAALSDLATPTLMDEWELTYSPEIERRFQSGAKTASRIDPKIAKLSGPFKIFYDANTWEQNLINETEQALAIQLKNTDTLIGLANYYTLMLKIPRVQAMTNERPYEAGNLIVETVNWEAMYDTVTAYMLQALLTNLTASYS